MLSGSPIRSPSAKEVPGRGEASLLDQLPSKAKLSKLPGDGLKRPLSSLSLQEKILLQRHALAQAAANAWACADGGASKEAASPKMISSSVEVPAFLEKEVGSSGATFAAFGLELPGKASPEPSSRCVAQAETQADSCQSSTATDALTRSFRKTSPPLEPCQPECASLGNRSHDSGSGRPKVDESDTRDTPLAEGVVVRISDRRFRISEALGTGSYGVVWCAQHVDGEAKAIPPHGTEDEYAVKEIVCKTQAELRNALFEGFLLKRLGEAGREGEAVASPFLASRIPRMAAQEAESLGEVWRVRLAMSRLPGEPLALALRSCKQQKLQELPAKEVLRFLAEPCRITSELLTQLGPVLQELSKTAYHRDVNPRNILVNEMRSEGRTSFGLVDFGMAVDVRRWLGSSKEDGGWKHLEVGGDCRYWPLSSWVMFMRGPQELGPGSPLRAEYQSGLDLHALGITALQVLMEQSPLLPAKPSGTSEQSVLLLAFRALQESWLRYWHDVSVFWESLMKCFATGGNWMALKASCIQTGLDRVLASRLSELRGALEDIGIASASLASASSCKLKTGTELEVLVRTLLTLLSNASSPEKWNKSSTSKQSPQTKQCSNKPAQKQVMQPPLSEHPLQDQQDQREQRRERHPQGSQAKRQSQASLQTNKEHLKLQTRATQGAPLQPRRENGEQGLPERESEARERQAESHAVPSKLRGERSARHSVAVPSFSTPGTGGSREGNGSLRQRSGSPIGRRMQPQASALQATQPSPAHRVMQPAQPMHPIQQVSPYSAQVTQINPPKVSDQSWWNDRVCVVSKGHTPSGPCVAVAGYWGVGVATQR